MSKLRIIILFAVCCMPMLMLAQHTENAGEIGGKTISSADSLTDLKMNTECSLPAYSHRVQPYSRPAYMEALPAENDSIHLPLLNMHGQVPLMAYPYDTWWGMDTWNLHRGLNVNLGASVFASFGKGAPKGAGFGQDLSVMYAVPLTGKLSLAVGGWLSNAYWAHDRFTDAGINAVLGYKFNEHWEAYVYGRKSIMNKSVPYRFYTMQELGDRVGAAVKYNISPSCSIQVSVSAGRCNVPAEDDYTMNHSWR